MKRFQVIQGGKGGGKEPTESGPSLYRAFSISNLTKGKAVYYDVRFNWYCLERDQPPFPYEDIIVNYERLDLRERAVMEREVKRLFTEREIGELKVYLEARYGMSLNAEKVSLPIEERVYLFEEGASVIYDFLELSEREGYPLSFRVWGYYTIEQCLASPILENGVMFLMKAFEHLKLNVDLSQSQLEAVTRALYDQEGFFVQSRKEEE